jgi:peroxiredoxin
MDRAIGIAVGSAAPTLTLRGTEGRRFSLAELRGRPVVLAFADGWKAQTEGALTAVRARLQMMNAVAIMMSSEQAWCVRPECESVETYSAPGEIAARVYGRARSPAEGAVLVVVDPDGIVRFHYAVEGGPAELTDTLAEALQAAARRVSATQSPARITFDEWRTLSLVASFVLAILEGRRDARHAYVPRAGRTMPATSCS